LAGYYAQKVAELEDNPQAWSIAGTSYGAGVKLLAEGSEKEFCVGRAIKAFEHAISLEQSYGTSFKSGIYLCRSSTQG
jgi:hypothetical protein